MLAEINKAPKDPVENRHINFSIYERSELPFVFIDFIQKNSQTLNELSTLILEIIKLTSSQLTLTRKLVSLGFLRHLINIIYSNKESLRKYFVKLAFDILWNYIELLETQAIQSIESEEVLIIFKNLFCIVHQTGYKLEDKILRNEIIVMINNLLEDGKLVKSVIVPLTNSNNMISSLECPQ